MDMLLTQLVMPDCVFVRQPRTTKKHTVQWLAQRAARLAGLDESLLLERLWEREQLGSTGIGEGIAIPHSRMPGLPRVFGMITTLANPIDFDALDDQPVDLIGLIISPEDAGALHLKALARMSRLFRDQTACRKMRGAQTPDALFAVLMALDRPQAA